MTSEILKFLEWFQKQPYSADEMERMFLDEFEKLFGWDLTFELKAYNKLKKKNLHFIPFLYEVNRLDEAYKVLQSLRGEEK